MDIYPPFDRVSWAIIDNIFCFHAANVLVIRRIYEITSDAHACFNKVRTDSWPLTHYRDVVSCVIKLDRSILEGILEPLSYEPSYRSIRIIKQL